jgi:hypothetical protein
VADTARITLSDEEAERVLANVCERTRTTPEFWDELAAEFIRAEREHREGLAIVKPTGVQS